MANPNTAGWRRGLLGITTVQSEGTNVAPRSKLNFVGGTVTSNAETDSIDVEFELGSALDTDNGEAPQEPNQTDTSDATPKTIGSTFALAEGALTTVDAQVQCIQAGASKAKVFNVRRHFLNAGGAITASTQEDVGGPDEIGGALSASVAITYTGTTGRIEITGVEATTLRWYIIRQAQIVTAAAASGGGTVPAAPTAISPTSGSTAGGTAVVITVPSSTGLTGAKVGGVALTGFAIDDATHVSGTTGAHAAGAVDVVVTNASGDSPALAAAFTYAAAAFDPFAVEHGAALGFREPDYATDGTTGTWTAEAGANAVAAADAPAAVGGAPDFTAAKAPLTCATTVATCWGTGDVYGFAVVDFDEILGSSPHPPGAYANPAIFSDVNQYVGLYSWFIGTKGVDAQYFVAVMDYAEADAAAKFAVVEITSLVAAATGAGQVTLQWKKTAGVLSIKAAGGAWQAGDAIAATAAAAQAGTMIIGADYNGLQRTEGRIRSLGLYTAAKDDAFAADVVTWSAAEFP